MAKLLNTLCKDIGQCSNVCPFSRERYLKVCTSFKISEPLSKGLENSKAWLSKDSVEKLTKELNEEAK